MKAAGIEPNPERRRRQNHRESRNMAALFRGDVIRGTQGRCAVCNVFAPYVLEVHHIRAIGDNGTGCPDNLVALCPTCHALVHKCRTNLAESPYFHDWLRNHYGAEGYERVFRIVYPSLGHVDEKGGTTE
jgi:hypothetical protein